MARPAKDSVATANMSHPDRYMYACLALGDGVRSHGSAAADLRKKITSARDHTQEADRHYESCYGADRGRCNDA